MVSERVYRNLGKKRVKKGDVAHILSYQDIEQILEDMSCLVSLHPSDAKERKTAITLLRLLCHELRCANDEVICQSSFFFFSPEVTRDTKEPAYKSQYEICTVNASVFVRELDSVKDQAALYQKLASGMSTNGNVVFKSCTEWSQFAYCNVPAHVNFVVNYDMLIDKSFVMILWGDTLRSHTQCHRLCRDVAEDTRLGLCKGGSLHMTIRQTVREDASQSLPRHRLKIKESLSCFRKNVIEHASTRVTQQVCPFFHSNTTSPFRQVEISSDRTVWEYKKAGVKYEPHIVVHPGETIVILKERFVWNVIRANMSRLESKAAPS